MTAKGKTKRKPQTQAGPSTSKRTRSKPAQPEQPSPQASPSPSSPGSAPPSPPPPPDTTLKTQFVNRKCKLGPLLRQDYSQYKNYFRTIAEEYSILRKDAINFTLLMLIQFFNTQQVENVRQYTNQIPVAQRSINRLNHYTRLADQLLAELLALLANIHQNIATGFENVTIALQNLRAPIDMRLNQLRPAILELNVIVQQMHTAITQENVDVALIDDLHNRLNHCVVNLRPQITAIQEHITQLLQNLRQIKTQLQNNLNTIVNGLPQEESTIVNNIFQTKDIRDRIENGRRTIQNRLDELRRGDMSEDEALLRTQLNTQMRIFIQNQQAVLTAYEQYQHLHQEAIRNNENIRQSLNLDTNVRQLQGIEDQNASLFQLAEIASQQLSLAVANPEGNQFFPKVTDGTFWSHVYRRVAIDTDGLNRTIQFNQSIQRNFPDFEISRKIAGSEEYAYEIPALDPLHIAISTHYGSTVIQNVVMHFLNTRLWVVRIFKGYFLRQQHPPQQEQRPEEQQTRGPQRRTLPIMTLAKKAADSIVNHRLFNQVAFRDENDEEVLEELPVFDGLIELYNRVRLIYEAEFAGLTYDQVNEYNHASSHPLKYLRISYRLLQLATSLPDTPIKLWSLIPESSHSILHVPLSGATAIYHLLKRAHSLNLQVPNNLTNVENVFIRVTDFQDLYFGDNKRILWNTIFNIEKFESEGLQLGFGLQTDGNMISILFEKTALNFVPENKKELHMQKNRKNIINWTKGMYPLYKNPYGITMEDRIIGIDPGVRDIIYAVDCDADQLTNKQTTKAHSLSISNASYKVRSGMSWLKDKELNNRAATTIQLAYDRLTSRKTCSNEGIMTYLNSLSVERTEIFQFMKRWRHRENKGYAYSNRKMALSYISRVVLGTTKVGEKFKLAHDSSKAFRRKQRKVSRQQVQQQLVPHNDHRRTVVAYGDASIRGTYKSNTPVPVKKVQRAIAEKAIVIPVDEFRTSVTCCHCQRRLNNVTAELNTCNHLKKKHRTIGVDKRFRTKCIDEEGNVLHLSSLCPDRRVVRRENVIYPLKLCNQCPVNGNNDLHWQRDVNAATNIRSILVEYVRSDYDIASRPAALSRGQQD